MPAIEDMSQFRTKTNASKKAAEPIIPIARKTFARLINSLPLIIVSSSPTT